MADEADAAAQPAAEPVAEPAPAAPAPAEAAAPAEPEATMDVTMTASFEGGRSLQAGKTETFAQSEAIRLIEAGFAVPAVPVTAEKATKKAPAETR